MGAAFLALIVVTAIVLAYTKYQDISVATKGSSEEGLIEVIRIGIYEYAVEAKKSGTEKIFPPFLDEAKLGPSTPDNLLFSVVTPKRIAVKAGVAVEGWVKVAKNEYTAPSGSKYIYDPVTGVFDVASGHKQ